MFRITGNEIAGEIDLNRGAKEVLQAVGYCIAENPTAIAQLLESYGIPDSDHLSERELTQTLLSAIGAGNPQFNLELSRIILAGIAGEGFDGFNLGSLLSQTQGEETSGTSGGLLGTLSGAMGSIGRLIGDKAQRKHEREQATAQTLQGIYTYKTQALAIAAQKKNKSKRNVLLITSLLVGCSLVAIIIYLRHRSTKAAIKNIS